MHYFTLNLTVNSSFHTPPNLFWLTILTFDSTNQMLSQHGSRKSVLGLAPLTLKNNTSCFRGHEAVFEVVLKDFLKK